MDIKHEGKVLEQMNFEECFELEKVLLKRILQASTAQMRVSEKIDEGEKTKSNMGLHEAIEVHPKTYRDGVRRYVDKLREGEEPAAFVSSFDHGKFNWTQVDIAFCAPDEMIVPSLRIC